MVERISRGECKVAGGKLVAVNVRVSDGRDASDGPGGPAPAVLSCSVDGDFFVDAVSDAASDALMRDIERALPASTPVADVLARHRDARLVGADAAAIEIAYARATAGGDDVAPHVAARTGRPDVPGAFDDMDDDAGFDGRWARLWPQLDVVHDVPRAPAEQMALDERWAREVADGRRAPTLRVWEWSAPCVVVGRFQSIPDEVNVDVAEAEGITVVRRCTGGGAMFIEPGNTITYSLYTPSWFTEGVSVEDAYRLCDRWLVGALRGLGLDVRFCGLNDIASSHGKIGGAAARRFPATGSGPGATLHHVTMAYDIDAAKMGRVLNTSRAKLSDKAVKSAVRRVDPLRSQTGMTRADVVAHLLAYCRDRSREGRSHRGAGDGAVQ